MKKINAHDLAGDSASYVGRPGTLIYDENTNSIKFHDGETPGGISTGGGGSSGAVASVNGQTGEVLLNLANLNDMSFNDLQPGQFIKFGPGAWVNTNLIIDDIQNLNDALNSKLSVSNGENRKYLMGQGVDSNPIWSYIDAIRLPSTGEFYIDLVAVDNNAEDIQTNANNHRIVALADPVNDQDAATKKYVDVSVGAIAALPSGTADGQVLVYQSGNKIFEFIGTLYDMGGTPVLTFNGGNLDATSHILSNLANPANPQDAATKSYVDNNSVSLPQSQANQLLVGVADADPEFQYISALYDGTGQLVFYFGGVTLNATGRVIGNVADPINPQDATNKAYVDASVLTKADASALGLKANTADLSVIATSGAYSDLIGSPVLATVATTGSYNDLVDKPLPTTIKNIVWVALNGDDTDADGSVDKKFRTVQAAHDYISATYDVNDGAVIMVAPGIYVEDFTFTRPKTTIKGFGAFNSGTTIQGNVAVDPSIVQGTIDTSAFGFDDIFINPTTGTGLALIGTNECTLNLGKVKIISLAGLAVDIASTAATRSKGSWTDVVLDSSASNDICASFNNCTITLSNFSAVAGSVDAMSVTNSSIALNGASLEATSAQVVTLGVGARLTSLSAITRQNAVDARGITMTNGAYFMAYDHTFLQSTSVSNTGFAVHGSATEVFIYGNVKFQSFTPASTPAPTNIPSALTDLALATAPTSV